MFLGDCYKFLGVPPDADEKTIRKAWRTKTKEVHPDVNKSKDAAAKFNRLTDAMNALLDPIERTKHDRQFGYLQKVKNKDTNAKQHFSESEHAKAKQTVDEWVKDYNVAMEMREKQKHQKKLKHKRNMAFILLGLLIGVIAITVWIHYLYSGTMDELLKMLHLTNS